MTPSHTQDPETSARPGRPSAWWITGPAIIVFALAVGWVWVHLPAPPKPVRKPAVTGRVSRARPPRPPKPTVTKPVSRVLPPRPRKPRTPSWAHLEKPFLDRHKAGKLTLAGYQEVHQLAMKHKDKRRALAWAKRAYAAFVANGTEPQPTLEETLAVLAMWERMYARPSAGERRRLIRRLAAVAPDEMSPKELQRLLHAIWFCQRGTTDPGLRLTEAEERVFIDDLLRRGDRSHEGPDSLYRVCADLFCPKRRKDLRRVLEKHLMDEDGWINLAAAKVLAWVHQRDRSLRHFMADMIAKGKKAGLTGDALAQRHLAEAYAIGLLDPRRYRFRALTAINRALSLAQSDEMRLRCIEEMATAARLGGKREQALETIARTKPDLSAGAKARVEELEATLRQELATKKAAGTRRR